MKRARMLIGTGVAGTLAIVGCGPDPNAKVTNVPTATQPAGTEVTNTGAPAGQTDAVTKQVQSYVAQFAQDDKDRAAAASKSNGKPGVTPAPAPSAPTTPTGAGIASAKNPPTTAPAAAMTPMQIHPPEERTEAAGSPRSNGDAETSGYARTAKVELVGVYAAGEKTTEPQPAGSGANQPTASVVPVVNSIDILITELEGSIKLHPQIVDDQFKLRLLYAATGHEDKAMGPIEGAEPAQQTLMTAVLKAVVSAKNSMQDPEKSSAAAIAATDELKRLIAQQAPVMVSKLAMVTRVNSFGDYDAVNPPKFPPGQSVHVFLYTEVKNFKSEATPQSKLRTVLSEKVEVFDSAGKVLWQRSEPTIEDKSASPRTDFFMTMEIELPAETAAGDYVLKVTVEDKLGGTTDQQRMGFTIGSN